MSLGVSERASKQVSEAERAKKAMANNCTVQANEFMDKQVAQYLHYLAVLNHHELGPRETEWWDWLWCLMD